MRTILLAEDEEPIARLITINLQKAGYQVTWADNGEKAADLLQARDFDLALFDILLPKVNGFELLDYARQCQVPVIFLTALGDTQTKVKGLKSGADDYLTKPFEIVELLARVEAVLRRYNKGNLHLQAFGITVDEAPMCVEKNGQPVNLTMKEYELLRFFIQNKGIVLYRETIYEKVWGGEYQDSSRTVDLHVQRLKKKLGWEHEITAVYKIGYRLEKE